MNKSQRKASAVKKPVAAKKVKKTPTLKTARRSITTKKQQPCVATPLSTLSAPVLSQQNSAPVVTTQRATFTVTSRLPKRQALAFQTFSAIPNLLSISLRRFKTGTERLTGTVKWFDSSKGFGFISNSNTGAELFVHFTSINTNGYRSLNEGQTVEYSIGSTAKGPAAVDVVPLAQEQAAI